MNVSSVTTTKQGIFILSAKNQAYGYGHYYRCQQLQSTLNKHRLHAKLLLYQSTDAINPTFTNYQAVWHYLIGNSAILLILDKRENPLWFVKKLQAHHIATIAFDSHGAEKKRYNYTIDAIPHLSKKRVLPRNSNLQGIGYLPPSAGGFTQTNSTFTDTFHVLLYLGGLPLHSKRKRSLALLFTALQRELSAHNATQKKAIPIQLWVALPKKHIATLHKFEAKYLKKITNLILTPFFINTNEDSPSNSAWRELTAKIHLVITHFGLAALEALINGIPVVLLNHTNYHQRLTQQHLKTFNFNRNFSYFAWQKKLQQSNCSLLAEKIGSRYSHIIEIIKTIHPILQAKKERHSFFAHNRCPLCKNDAAIVYRKEYFNLSACQKCRHVFMVDLPLKTIFQKNDVQYHDDYFKSEYQKSYGKTYLEDKEHITLLSHDRLKVIEHITPKKLAQKKLLDVGCAYGFFLDAAKSLHYHTEGLEISQAASQYASKNHVVHRGSFIPLSKSLKKQYEVISLWFVIEHFKDIDAVITSISRLQQKNGLTCISTPNALGFSGRFKRSYFLDTSPDDHYHIFSVTSLTRFFKRHGYAYVTSTQTGIHRQRLKEKFSHLSNLIGTKMYGWLALQWRLGDTFNAYFKKIK